MDWWIVGWMGSARKGVLAGSMGSLRFHVFRFQVSSCGLKVEPQWRHVIMKHRGFWLLQASVGYCGLPAVVERERLRIQRFH